MAYGRWSSIVGGKPCRYAYRLALGLNDDLESDKNRLDG